MTTQEYSPSVKVYPTENLGKYSILDMLQYFEEHGALRVSDLHIKVGAPPAYRIDGNLVKLKGPNVTPEIAKQLIFPLLKEHALQKLQTEHSVDGSYRMGTCSSASTSSATTTASPRRSEPWLWTSRRSRTSASPMTSGRTSSISRRGWSC